MNIDVGSVISVLSLIIVIVLIPQITFMYILGKIIHHDFKLIRRIQFTVLGLAVIAHWYLMVVLLLFLMLVIVACGLMLNARRTIYILACVLHIRWLAIWASDEIVYIDE